MEHIGESGADFPDAWPDGPDPSIIHHIIPSFEPELAAPTEGQPAASLVRAQDPVKGSFANPSSPGSSFSCPDSKIDGCRQTDPLSVPSFCHAYVRKVGATMAPGRGFSQPRLRGSHCCRISATCRLTNLSLYVFICGFPGGTEGWLRF